MKNKISTIVLLLVLFVSYVWYVEFYKDEILFAFMNPVRIEEGSVDQFDCSGCNLIVISLSNVSAKHMSLYGYERLTTPNIDKWAKNAFVFENAFTQSSWTLPVGVSFFTSLYPYSHGIMNRITNNVLGENIQTLPEILKSNGYRTAAFTGGLDYAQGFGHMRGFDEINEEGADSSWPTNFAGFDNTFHEATSWIAKNSNNNFFIFLHGYDTHCPFVPPVNFKGIFSSTKLKPTVDNTLCVRGYRDTGTGSYDAYYYKDGQQKVILGQDDIKNLEDSYDEEILSVDNLLSDFLGSIEKKILDKTIVVIISDHGEMFAKHGRFGRAGAIRGTLYDDVLHIPLIIKLPGVEGRKIDGLVQIIDVMPTLLKFLDIPYKNNTLSGKDLSPLIKGNEENINKYIFAGSEFKVDLVDFVYNEKSINEVIRDKKWKLIHEVIFNKKDETVVTSETYELYDVSHDPNELENLINKEEKVAENLKTQLKVWADSARGFTNKQIKTEALSQDFLNEARKMGYW